MRLEPGPARIGVGITTRNRNDRMLASLDCWSSRLPKDALLVVVDDASAEPGLATFRFCENVGVAVAKNKCIELLVDNGCEHLFLADDDTWPTTDDWWRPYVESPEPHLMYQPTDLPAHWKIRETHRDEQLVAYDRPRGCLLYVDARVLPIVGGMSTAFGKHGGEHGNWSDRIHTAGLTSYAYADVAGPPRFHCADEDAAGLSTVVPSALDGWRHVDPARIPTYCEYRPDPVPALVARRNDHGHRDRLWRYLRQSYWSRMPYALHEGHHVEGPFNRSLGLNLAADLAGNWDVALLIDSDVWVPPAQVAAAVNMARDTGRLVSALTEVRELDQPSTDHVLELGVSLDYWPELTYERIRTKPLETQSLMLAIPRNLWEQVRGFDEKCVGWGGEDNCLWLAATICAGEPLRIDGPAFHLWHEPASRKHQSANIQRLRLYQRARTRNDLARLR